MCARFHPLPFQYFSIRPSLEARPPHAVLCHSRVESRHWRPTLITSKPPFILLQVQRVFVVVDPIWPRQGPRPSEICLFKVYRVGERTPCHKIHASARGRVRNTRELAHQPLTAGTMAIGAEQGRSEYRVGDSPAIAASPEKRSDTLWSQHDRSMSDSAVACRMFSFGWMRATATRSRSERRTINRVPDL